MDALAKEGGVDGEVVFGGPAPDEGEVFFLDAGALHEHAEMAGGRFGFGDKGEAAGFAIEAVDDGDLAAIGQFEREEVAEEMPEGGDVGGFTGVDLEERGFVDDDPVGGLGDDFEAGRDRRGNLNRRA